MFLFSDGYQLDDYYDRRAGFDRVATDIGLSRYAADDDEDDDVRSGR